MRKIKRLCTPMLLGVLLMATVVGVASARPSARPQQQAWRVLTVSTSACTELRPDIDFEKGPGWVDCNSGTCHLLCPVYFPAAGEQAVGAVNVKRVTMYAWDNYPAQSAQFWLSKHHPPSRADLDLAHAESTPVNTNPQAVVDYTIENNPIYRVQGPYLWVQIGGPAIAVYGFYIHYTWM